MLGLGSRRLEGTGEDGEFSIPDHGGHLWVGHVLVDKDPTDEGGISQGAPDFAVDFDEIEWNVFTLYIGYSKDGIDGDLSELGMFLRYSTKR
jgi:hypothetical protein